MERFRGQIDNVFEIPNRGFVLNLNHVEGLPQINMHIRAAEWVCKITELGRNSTDGQVISTRPCLTGKPVTAYGSIAVEWIGSAPTNNENYKLWVREEARN